MGWGGGGGGDAQRQEEEAASAMYDVCVEGGEKRVLCGSYSVPFEAKE